ncbi:alpha/beta fold hydrolase [Phormidium sp. CCY1219]|uniref:alpha/beta fold hydrolase n=1 Tax=Phormidium sp. CCY1219 TaxID=2886104 RepID=UPI002D1F455A|nr:alpha/beta hydrolase [Phormidium sp. CCY1219]MEB3828538.1 alpha/beta hydrolase [Phormidium sp. CCY1219]
MPYIQVRGVKHYYEWIGQETPIGNKPVLVFLHGWAGSGRYWQTTARALLDEFDCLLYDMRGFGRSRLPLQPPALDYELETYADDLAALLDELQLERVYLNAHSMGASVATLFLNRYPERVEKAILTCSGIFEYDEKAFSAFHKWGSLVVKYRPRWLAFVPMMDRMFMARFLYRPIQAAASRAFLSDYLMADYEAAVNTIFTSVSKKATEVMPREFSQLQVPVLLVAGERDRIIPAEMGRQAAALNPSFVQFVEIADTAHFPMLEDSVTYLNRVREFLNTRVAESPVDVTRR